MKGRSMAESSQPDPPGGCCTAQLPRVWSRQHCGAVYVVFIRGLTANIIGLLDDPCPNLLLSATASQQVQIIMFRFTSVDCLREFQSLF